MGRLSTVSRLYTAMQSVSFGKSLPGYEIGDKTFPAVIVVQEWWGITDVMKELSTKLHRLGGYRVLLPDLYKGKIGVDKEEARHMMSELNWDAAVDEMKQAVSYLKETGSSKVGVTGFCMGGALSFLAAQHANVDCAAAFYGIPPPSGWDPASIKIPVQGHFGKLDTLTGFSDAKTAEKLEETMKEAGVKCQFFYYENAGHAFMNEGDEGDQKRDSEISFKWKRLTSSWTVMGFPHPPDVVRAEAWRHLTHFFGEHLKPHT